MKARKIIDANVGGRPVDMMEFTTEKPTNRWMLFLPGTGQLGPADGSQLHEMDDYGYQRNLSFETDFNILAPQAQKGYSEFEFTILQWMVDTYGQDIEIFLAGHSLGARQVMEYINKYRGLDVTPQVVGAMPVAGEMSGPYQVDPCANVDVKVMAVHGDRDSAINKVQSEKFVSLLNKCPDRINKAVLDIVVGAGHTDVMKTVFAYDKESKYYKFIMSCFSDKYEGIECTAVLNERLMTATFKLPDGTETEYVLGVKIR